MPCKHENHHHEWATEGEVVIERCEKICYFCGKEWKHAWFLRRHVRNVHQRQYPDLVVIEGWTGAPLGNKTPDSTPQKRGRHARTPSVSGGSRTSSVHTRTPSAKSLISRRDSGLDTNPESFTGHTVPEMAKDFNADAFTLPAEQSFMGPLATEVAQDCNAVDNYAANLKYDGLPAPDTAIGMDPTLDLYELFPECIPQDFGATTCFVTPQTVRKDGGFIQAVVPSVEHHPAAETFAQGLNNIVHSVVAGGRMSEEEVLYVLETFAGTFKIGMAMPW